jgi:uncharacterized 2Fe-2S/4Fe-4S cluster protein (DUF4445 family)
VVWEERKVLACQIGAERDGVMQIPRTSLVSEEFAVESAFAPPLPRRAQPRCRQLLANVPSSRELPGVSDWERLCRALFTDGAPPSITPDLLCKLPPVITAEHAVRVTIVDDQVVDIQDQATAESPVLGLAVDVGTTTVVARLIDMRNGEELAISGTQNRQVSLGANVISRIDLGSQARGLTLLTKMINEKTILPLIEKCRIQSGCRTEPIHALVAGGNTAMTHLLLGLPPNGLGVMPFNAVTLTPEPLAGSKLKLPVERVECLPCAGAYVGGDIVGGIYALGLDRSGPPELLIDIGTNSEMVLRVGDKLLAASAPAGPAFEGGGLTCGGPASPGAITRVRIEDRGVAIETYKNSSPTHICGSAYIDLLADFRKHGLLTNQGRFVREQILRRNISLLTEPAKGSSHVSQRLVLAPEVSIDERDISLLLQAKAAVLSGALILLRTAGISVAELKVIHVAGGFGRHLNPANSIRSGLLPDVALERINIVGNTSLSACSSALLNGRAEADMRDIARRVQIIELNLEPDFEEQYINALMLP